MALAITINENNTREDNMQLTVLEKIIILVVSLVFSIIILSGIFYVNDLINKTVQAYFGI